MPEQKMYLENREFTVVLVSQQCVLNALELHALKWLKWGEKTKKI